MNRLEQLAALRKNGHHRQAELLARIVAMTCPDCGRTITPRGTPNHRRAHIRDVAAGVLAKTVRRGGCLEFTGIRNREGYGRASKLGRLRAAHRIVYEALVGPIAEGLELDHLCRNRACVNVAHLEPVTPRENTHPERGRPVSAATSIRPRRATSTTGLTVARSGSADRANCFARTGAKRVCARLLLRPPAHPRRPTQHRGVLRGWAS